jgi:hypothetical protein
MVGERFLGTSLYFDFVNAFIIQLIQTKGSGTIVLKPSYTKYLADVSSFVGLSNGI